MARKNFYSLTYSNFSPRFQMKFRDIHHRPPVMKAVVRGRYFFST